MLGEFTISESAISETPALEAVEPVVDSVSFLCATVSLQGKLVCDFELSPALSCSIEVTPILNGCVDLVKCALEEAA